MEPWIIEMLDEYKHIRYTCPVCGWSGEDNYDSYILIESFKYCPNCADKKKEDDETTESEEPEDMEEPEDKIGAILKAINESEPEMALRYEPMPGSRLLSED